MGTVLGQLATQRNATPCGIEHQGNGTGVEELVAKKQPHQVVTGSYAMPQRISSDARQARPIHMAI